MTADELARLEGIVLGQMVGVHEQSEGWPVELRRDFKSGRLGVVAFNEGHNNSTWVDLCDLLDWLTAGPPLGRIDGGFAIALGAKHGSDSAADRPRS